LWHLKSTTLIGHKERAPVYAEYRPHFSRAQGTYPPDEAREKTLQKVTDAHRAACFGWLLPYPYLPGAFLLQNHCLYAVAQRFIGQGHYSAFDDRQPRGPKPLVDQPANERIERLVEEELPASHGWLRSRWSCKLLAVELFKERAVVLSQETVRRVLHHLGFRWRRPRPVPPSKNPHQKRERLQQILKMLREYKASFFQDETKLETNPRVGFCWMRKGKQKRLRTPGTNRKVWISGALQWSTGRFHWVRGERKNGELFMKLLEELGRIYPSSDDKQRLELAIDNDSSHTSKRVKEYVEASGGRVRLHPLPAWSPQSNPVELIWWSLHEAVSRNHTCKELSDLVEFAEGYLQERQPFTMDLGADYEQLGRSPP
jgi:transposase